MLPFLAGGGLLLTAAGAAGVAVAAHHPTKPPADGSGPVPTQSAFYDSSVQPWQPRTTQAPRGLTGGAGYPISLSNVYLQTKGGIGMATDPLGVHGQVIRVVADPSHSVMTPHAAGPRSEMMTRDGLRRGGVYTIQFKFLNVQPNSGVTFFQILDWSTKRTQDRIKLGMGPGGYTLMCRTSATDSGKAVLKTLSGTWSGDVGRWTDWRIVFKRDPSAGYVEVYKDGQMLGSVQGVATMYSSGLSDPNAHAKFGQYKHSVVPPTTVYFADIRIVTS